MRIDREALRRIVAKYGFNCAGSCGYTTGEHIVECNARMRKEATLAFLPTRMSVVVVGSA